MSKWEKFKHTHYTRDIRPHDCPQCRIQMLEANVKELERLAESWQLDYERLRQKYEPDTLAYTEAAIARPIKDGDEPSREVFRYKSPRRGESMSLKEFLNSPYYKEGQDE